MASAVAFDVRHQGLLDPPEAASMAPAVAVDVPLMDVPVIYRISAVLSDYLIDPPVAVSMAPVVAVASNDIPVIHIAHQPCKAKTVWLDHWLAK